MPKIKWSLGNRKEYFSFAEVIYDCFFILPYLFYHSNDVKPKIGRKINLSAMHMSLNTSNKLTADS